MRDYGKVTPQFWTGQTGKALRGNPEAQIVAMYLITNPHANMIGVYNLPILYLTYETGLPESGVRTGLDKCVDLGLCLYDEETETVFVIEMAAHQVGDYLKESDKRAASIGRQYKAITSPKIASAFYDRYGDSFNLEAPLQAPLKGGKKGHKCPPSPAPVIASKKKSNVTLADWAASLGDADAVPADDPIFGWARTAGVPPEWIGLAWWAFENRYGADGKDAAKTYTDWRAVFRTAVKEDWLRLWRKGRDGWELTTAGQNVQAEMEAQA